jgi:hypothetical protein
MINMKIIRSIFSFSSELGTHPSSIREDDIENTTPRTSNLNIR